MEEEKEGREEGKGVEIFKNTTWEYGLQWLFYIIPYLC